MLKSLIAALRRLFASLSPGNAPKGPARPQVAAAAPAAIAAQPMTMTIDANGIYPSPGSGGAMITVGMVHAFAGSFAPFGAPQAKGARLPIAEYQLLYTVLGSTWGPGDGASVALPDLTKRAAMGASDAAPLGTATGETLAMTWMIATSGFWPGQGYPLLGMMALFAAGTAPAGWTPADGRLLPVASNQALFALLGTSFGGDLRNFALPDLRGRVPVGIGQVPGGPGIGMGQRIDSGPVPGLGLNLAICGIDGLFPVREGGSGYPEDAVLGEIVAFAGTTPLFEGSGWFPAIGAVLPISVNQALFAIIGKTYGGDGVTTFALPDLRGRMLVGS